MFIIVLLSIIAFYLLFMPIFIYFVPDVVLRGQIGDSFGVATSIVTALAFMGVIWSIRQSDKHHAEQLEKQQEELRLQRKELQFQREELRDTKEEIRGQKEQLVEQNKTLEHQNFEHSFYQLLNLYDKTVNTIKVIYPFSTLEGRKSFRAIYESFNMTTNFTQFSKWSGVFEELSEYLESEEVVDYPEEEFPDIVIWEELGLRIDGFNKDMRILFESYFKVVIGILKLIDVKSNIETERRSFQSLFRSSYMREVLSSGYYVDILKSQLSNHELAALYYYALKEDELKKLIEKHSLLEGLDFNLIVPKTRDDIEGIYGEKLERTRNMFKNLYKSSAYGE